MGGLSSYDPDFKRPQLIDEVVHDYKREGTYLDHSAVGNTLYVAIKAGDYSVILVYLMYGPARGEGGGWVYRVLDESQAPVVDDCPEKLLKLSTCEVPEAIAWRQRCRDKRKKRNEQYKYLRSLQPGDKVKYDGRELTFRWVSSRNFFVALDEKGKIYKYRVVGVDLPQT